MLIRKNTKVFKTILEIMAACKDRPDREKLIRHYITKAGYSIKDRISVEGIQGEAGLFYEMNYHAVLNSLESSNRQLHESDDTPGIYFFHSASNKAWDETPFEFDEAIKKEFASLPDLPVVRKKEKAEKYVFPAPGAKTEPRPSRAKTEAKPIKKEKVETKKAAKVINKGPRQPDYKLKHKIQFTDLQKVVFRKPQLTRNDVLDYYNKIAEYILPYLKDRPQSIRLLSKDGRNTEYKTLDALPEGLDWIQTANTEQGRVLLCNNKEHLLFYVEIGCLEFNCCHSRTKSLELPDYIVIEIESPEAELGKAIDVALTARDILSGLQLPSFVKTDGQSGLHIYVPLDSKCKFKTSKAVAEYICKLIRLKVPGLVNMEGSNDRSYGKVSLDYKINEVGKSLVAPYSLVPGESASVATPLLWEEVKEDHQLQYFNHETIFKRLKKIGDPFETLFRKKVNADTLLERMDANYSFLF
jgi:DNA ligase D-like protein (predicted polymerase)